MKRLQNIFLLLLVMSLNYSCSNFTTLLNHKKVSSNKFKIKEIRSSYEFYIIDAERNDSIFRIVTLKDSLEENKPDIFKGGEYSLNVYLIYPSKKRNLSTEEINKHMIKSAFINLDRKTNYQLYVTTSLNGLKLENSNTNPEQFVKNFHINEMFCDACVDNKFTYILYYGDLNIIQNQPRNLILWWF